MTPIRFYALLNNRCDEVLEKLEEAKKHYQDDPETQRAFAIAETNIQTALMWINKGLYAAKENQPEEQK